ncbi:TOMM precursor leader peptide-binding protein [Saccharothrix mutabilis subsp. mutabilis]|uniref:TOMM leader peptide-binding protein n=1 Tax=Saccharothrix mutabilis subsp. mutabilis TaxID=66855 RepID=A0ABN0UX34_9PSEU
MPGGGSGLRVGFKRHLRAHVVRGDAVYVLSERGATAVRGAHVEAVAPLLDGTRGLEDLVRECPEGLSPAEVGAVVMGLVEADLVTVRPADQRADDPALAYWEAAGVDPSAATAATTAARVGLITVGPCPEGAARAVTDAGVTITRMPGNFPLAGSDLSIVLCDDYLEEGLADVDAAHRAAGRPWLIAKPGGAQVWLGPVFDPAAGTGCWHCLAHRLRGHRQAETRLRSLGDTPVVPPEVSLPPLRTAALNLVAMEAVKWLAGLRHDGQRAVWTLDSVGLGGKHHELRARPQCPECGDSDLMRGQALRPMVLQSRRKASRTGGGHRSRSPEQVLRDHGHLVSPVTGVVKEITRDDRGPAFLNSFRSGPNLALTTRRDADQMRSALRAENGGKGVTPLHAEVSALCEAVERHSAYFHGDEATVTGRFADLEDAVHPNECLLFDERQYADRERWNATCSPFQHVCAPFDETAETTWTPVWSLTEQRHRLLPTSMLYFDVPARHGGASLNADSNGNAAGASLEDALLQGLLELVERDAVALWWYNRTQAPAVDLDSFGDRWVDELREVYAGLHREVWVLDVSSDVGIPTMAALSRRTDKRCEDVMFGFGAHPDPAVALVRALTEMNQLLPAVVDARDDHGGYGWSDPDAVRWWRTATWEGDPWLRPDPEVIPRTRAHYEHTPTDDLRHDVTALQHDLESLGLNVMVLDQTRPDVGLPVVKAIVPGMRGFWARFAPGRLFDVPVKLGRLARPTAYESLNPIPLFV